MTEFDPNRGIVALSKEDARRAIRRLVFGDGEPNMHALLGVIFNQLTSLKLTCAAMEWTENSICCFSKDDFLLDESRLQEALELRLFADIALPTNTPRFETIIVALFDEVAFFRDVVTVSNGETAVDLATSWKRDGLEFGVAMCGPKF